ncbi:histidine phosphatase family protein [Hwanghaeella grinnelliae]|uniref:Histidine phosphatase family protein n=1 Tax=Hwanghaeella grinnelliae TaxID=2500179 RepID=A0A3S2VQG8_9PROT|nr:histidine phosphatase family protein [Hwanghaeella grinnelliae]RVU39256.1 histidine phosphatase family protein [Hwanghaeella grinnelliae]
MSLPGTKNRRRIFLMRHGEVDYRGPDGKLVNPKLVTLTEYGIGQAKAASAMMSGVQIDRAVCSGLPRTRMTAELVLDGQGAALEEDQGFLEIRGGRVSSVPEADRAKTFIKTLDQAHLPGARFAGGDEFAPFYDRVTCAFRNLAVDGAWRRMLLVAHDGVNRAILSWVSGAGLAGLKAFEQDMGCVNIVDFDVEGGVVTGAYIKATNITPYNYVKTGLYQTSFEQVFKPIFGDT